MASARLAGGSGWPEVVRSPLTSTIESAIDVASQASLCTPSFALQATSAKSYIENDIDFSSKKKVFTIWFFLWAGIFP